MRVKPLPAAAVLLILALVLISCKPPAPPAGSGAKKKVILTLNWTPFGEHAPFYYGVKNGFYQAENIDLEIKPGSGSGKTLDAVAGRESQFGWVDTPALLAGINNGMKVKSIGVYLQKGPSAVEFFTRDDILEPSDLRGKTVGGTPGEPIYDTFPAFLKANGMTPGDVRVVNISEPRKINVLADGKVDAIMGSFNDQVPTIENTTNRSVSHFLYADSGVNIFGTGLVVNNAALRSDPEMVKGFVRATKKSWTEALKHIGDAAGALAEMTEQQPVRKVLVDQLVLTAPLVRGTPGVNSEGDWSKTITLLAQNAGLKRAGPPSKYWDSDIAGKK